MKVLLLMIYLFSSLLCRADDIFIIFAKKEEEKKTRGFNLVDWLSTKKRIALMDQWLALNTSAVIFESLWEIGQSDYDLKKNDEIENEKNKGTMGHVGAFVTIFGVEYAYHQMDTEDIEDLKGSLRLLGSAYQTTHLNLEYGQKKWSIDQGDTYKNPYLGGHLNFYLLNFLGLEAHYKEYQEHESKLGKKVSGDYFSYGGFLDLSFIRMTYRIFSENLNIKEDINTLTDKRKGAEVLLSLFL